MRTYQQITLACVAAVSLALAGCSSGTAGQAGAQGAPGATGAQGTPGTPGTSASPGSITGTVTFVVAGTSYPASGVTVAESPDQGVTATTAPDGTYTLSNLPAGFYTVTFTGPATEYKAAVTATASVVSGSQAGSVNATLVKLDPLVVTIAATVDAGNALAGKLAGSAIPVANAVNPVGFNQPVDLQATASYSDGTTPGNLSYTWSVTAGPSTAASLIAAGATPDTAVFTTQSISALIDPTGTGAVPNFRPESSGITAVTPTPSAPPYYSYNAKPSFVGITTEMLTKMTYTVQVVVTDSSTGWTTSKTINVVPATLAQATVNVPVGTTVIGFDTVKTPTWKLTFTGLSQTALPGSPTTSAWGASGVAGTPIVDSNKQYAWFVPDVPGVYTLQDTATGGTTLLVHAADVYAGAYADALTETSTPPASYGGSSASPCMDCHSGSHGEQAYNWSYGFHGDYNSGTDQAGLGTNAIAWDPAPAWSSATPPAFPNPPMATIFQVGITGGIVEGGTPFYSASCMGCHTTGFNAASTALNGGFDDVMATDKWAFPKTFTASNWTNLPANLQHLAGIQCESCHGANTMEGFISAAPASFADPNAGAANQLYLVPSYSATMCGQCHDEPSFHDKFAMWSKGAHAATAPVNRGAVDSTSPNLAVVTNSATLPAPLTITAPFTAFNYYPNYGAGNCGRCHTAQGFVAFVNQLAANGSACAAPAGSGIIPNSCYLQPTMCGSTPANGCFDPVQGTYSSKTSTYSGTPNQDLEKYLAGLGMISVPYATVKNANFEPNGTAITTFASTQQATVQPQTCQACHDPHSTLVRVFDSTPTLQVGFSVQGAGSGALCIVCHNNRAGPRSDGITTFPISVLQTASTNASGTKVTPTVIATVPAIGTAHDGPQGDVFWGQNAFFMNGALMPSKHAAVADTCVGCHVALADSSGSTSNFPNHTFRVDSLLCASCHTSGVDGAGITGAYVTNVNALGSTILQVFQKALKASSAAQEFLINGKTTVVPFNASLINWSASSALTAAQPTSNQVPLYVSQNYVAVSNQSTITLSFNTAIPNPDYSASATTPPANQTTVSSYAVSVSNLFVNASGSESSPTWGAQVLSSSGLFAKAFWNVTLVTNDHSNSVHNPSFVNAVIANTQNALLNPGSNPY